MEIISPFARNILQDSVGKSKGIQYDNIPGLDDAPGAVSVAAWFKRLEASDGLQHIIYTDQLASDADDGGVRLYENSAPNDTIFDIKTDAVFAKYSCLEDVFTLSEWVHVCGTWQGTIGGSVPKFYVNGVQHTGGSATNGTGTRASAPGSHSIGGRESTQARGAGGLITGLGRWQRELSAVEVSRLSRGLHPIELHPHDLVICPDFRTLENVALRGTSSLPNLIEHDGGLYEGPPQLQRPLPRFALADVPADVRHVKMPRVRTKQPTVGIQIDWTNPITQGLAFVFNGADPNVEAVSRVTASTMNVSTIGGHKEMVGRSGESSSSLIEFTNCFDASEEFFDEATLFSIYRPHERFTIANTCTLFFSGSDINFPMLRLGWVDNATDAVQMRVSTAPGSNRTSLLSANDVAPPGEIGRTIGVVRGDGTNSLTGEVWHNGINVVASSALISQAETIVGASLSDSATVLGDNNLQDRGACVDLFLSCCWNRALSEAEIQSIDANPWQIFKPSELIVPINESLPDVGVFERSW